MIQQEMDLTIDGVEYVLCARFKTFMKVERAVNKALLDYAMDLNEGKFIPLQEAAAILWNAIITKRPPLDEFAEILYSNYSQQEYSMIALSYITLCTQRQKDNEETAQEAKTPEPGKPESQESPAN